MLTKHYLHRTNDVGGIAFILQELLSVSLETVYFCEGTWLNPFLSYHQHHHKYQYHYIYSRYPYNPDQLSATYQLHY